MPRTYKSFQRLYVGHDLMAGGTVALGKEQTNYVATVMRMKAGDSLVLFNGRDGAWLGKIVSADKKGVILELEVQTAHQTPPADLWYGFAPLKTGRLDYVVQKATEMGAGVIQPVITRFTQVHKLKPEKLTANVIEAAEQCEVLSVPTVAPEISLAELLRTWRDVHGLRRLIVADEEEPAGSPVSRLRQIDGLPIGLLVGPEGGFAEEERAALRAQDFIVPISLGPRILRADTAAVAALAIVQAIIGDWR